MNALTTFLQNAQLVVERYWLWVSTLIVAIMSIVIYRQNTKISDLQQQAALAKVNGQLSDALDKAETSQEDYNDSIQKYQRLKSHYNALFSDPANPS